MSCNLSNQFQPGDMFSAWRGMPLWLEPSEVAARIKAARLLRGMTQDELANRLAEAGLPWRLAGALERGEQELRTAHRAALARALGFSERWFTVPVDELCPPEAAETVITRLDDLRFQMQRVMDRLGV